MIAGFLLDIIADVLNLKWLGKPMPEEFIGYYPEDKYLNSMNYTKTLTYFGFITSSFDLAIMLVFWFSGGFSWLNSIVISVSENYLIRGILFIGILSAANSILSLPFGIYSTFVIEEKYGFNKTTIKTYIFDILKSAALTLILGVPLIALVLYILQESGNFAWLYGWGSVTIIGLIIQYIAPRWIMPLFNKFTPMEDSELKNAIMEYVIKVDFRLKDVYIMDGSKRSSKSNAFFTGFGKNKRIALYDTLIEKHSVSELVAILAHEIGHYKHKHIQTAMVLSFFHTGLVFYILSIFLKEQGLYEAFFVSDTPIYAGLLFFGMLYSPIETFLSLFFNHISRKNELTADKYAVTSTSDKESFILALKKLSVNNLSNLTPHPFLVFLTYSHPTLLYRISKIKEI